MIRNFFILYLVFLIFSTASFAQKALKANVEKQISIDSLRTEGCSNAKSEIDTNSYYSGHKMFDNKDSNMLKLLNERQERY